jgi:hypothetical protein
MVNIHFGLGQRCSAGSTIGSQRPVPITAFAAAIWIETIELAEAESAAANVSYRAAGGKLADWVGRRTALDPAPRVGVKVQMAGILQAKTMCTPGCGPRRRQLHAESHPTSYRSQLCLTS